MIVLWPGDFFRAKPAGGFTAEYPSSLALRVEEVGLSERE